MTGNGRERKILLGINVVIAICAVVIAASLVVSQIRLAKRVDVVLTEVQETQLESAEQRTDHRVRNEILHACIVDLIFAVVQSEPGSRAEIPNPCPTDEHPVDIPGVEDYELSNGLRNSP